MQTPLYPALYQLNTRVRMTELSLSLSHAATLDDIADAELDHLAEMGFDWLWLLSVWQTGPAAQRISRNNAAWRREFEQTLPDLREEDIAGSGFAITNYTVHRDLGGDEALARLRTRARQRGLRLMLDFVPNHMALDHAWRDEHPDYFVHGSEEDLVRSARNYCRLATKSGPLLLAHGRDPYFDGWPDTLQLNYGNQHLQQAMIGELERIADQCDGVRCDMAMLVLPEVFERTWGIRPELFWPKAKVFSHFCEKKGGRGRDTRGLFSASLRKRASSVPSGTGGGASGSSTAQSLGESPCNIGGRLAALGDSWPIKRTS